MKEEHLSEGAYNKIWIVIYLLLGLVIPKGCHDYSKRHTLMLYPYKASDDEIG
jgi:hypothetical protein